ncbi:MAG: hypothetical protein EA398_07895 [Deltaproteobacteria bacterium]|nr:MAG: hypothetical protein EA398_07895 [Deltaproteobacteria bacterium]
MRVRLPSTLRTLARAASLGLVALAATSCEREQEHSMAFAAEIDRHHEAVVHDLFDRATSPRAVVATVGDRDLRVVDVALWLELFPMLSVDQAVEDLIELLAMVETSSAEGTAWPDALADGAQRGRARGWMRTVSADEQPASSMTDGEVAAESLPDVVLSQLGRPATRMVSHVLVPLPADASEGLWRSAEHLVRELAEDLNALPEPSRQDLADAVAVRLERESDDVPAGVRVEGPFRVAERNRGVVPGGGVRTVVLPFAEAAFAGPVGQLGEPVRTRFGVHAILVHGHVDASWAVTDEEVDRILRGQARAEQAGNALVDLRRRHRAVVDAEAAELLSLDAFERMRRERAEALAPGQP